MRGRAARGPDDMVDEGGRGRLAVGAGDPDDLVLGKRLPRQCEKLDVADQRHSSLAGAGGDGVAVQRNSGRDDDPVEAVERRRQRIGEPCCSPAKAGGQSCLRIWTPAFAGEHLPQRLPSRLVLVPGHHLGAAGEQRLDRRQTGAGETVDRIFATGEGGARDHLSFRVDRPARARTKAMIQKRMTMVASDQPICSKWWWMGAILKIRRPVLL